MKPEEKFERKPNAYVNNGEVAHTLIARPESWRKRNLRGLTRASSVESIAFLTWVCDRAVRENGSD